MKDIFNVINYIDEALLIQHGIRKTDCTMEKDKEKSVNLFNFDENGFCTMYTNNSYRDGERVSTNHLSFINDKYGNPISTYVSTPSDGISAPIAVCDYTYNNTKPTIVMQKLRNDETDEWVYMKETIEYNNDGSLANINLYLIGDDGHNKLYVFTDITEYEDDRITGMVILTNEGEYLVDLLWIDGILDSIKIRDVGLETDEATLKMEFNLTRFIGSSDTDHVETEFEFNGFSVKAGYMMKAKKEDENEQ